MYCTCMLPVYENTLQYKLFTQERLLLYPFIFISISNAFDEKAGEKQKRKQRYLHLESCVFSDQCNALMHRAIESKAFFGISVGRNERK